jgi:hypothetical protein
MASLHIVVTNGACSGLTSRSRAIADDALLVSGATGDHRGVEAASGGIHAIFLRRRGSRSLLLLGGHLGEDAANGDPAIAENVCLQPQALDRRAVVRIEDWSCDRGGNGKK